jgi:hypothetical protein
VHDAACRAGATGRASLRLWRRARPVVSLGRFHRRGRAHPALERRLSGGRVTGLGPGVLGVTMVAPGVDWFDPSAGGLRPDQVLNRALRPLLNVLRSRVPEVFYPGRHLVGPPGRPLAHASFTVQRDGVAIVEVHLGVECSIAAGLAERLAELDPDGDAAVDPLALADAVALADAAGPSPHSAPQALAEALARASIEGFDCRMVESWSEDEASGLVADEAAFEAFQAERGPCPKGPDRILAAGITMLGVVESSARLIGDRLYDLEITGDVIAPAHALEEIAAACEGQPLRAPKIRRALAGVLIRPRSFLLGANDLDAIIERMQ